MPIADEDRVEPALGGLFAEFGINGGDPELRYGLID
jgi:hypothetical protein